MVKLRWRRNERNAENEAITEINKETMNAKRDGMCNQFYLLFFFIFFLNIFATILLMAEAVQKFRMW